ncbi:MAG: hypothetical protein JRI23_22510, partial [Deltaproteobacteria bacterium]|nr:hypothetical protein [Deltaproteobacteria bacterium]MBW2534727.1 hypothetical protein [Deltaproteobacteria bacterium]
GVGGIAGAGGTGAVGGTGGTGGTLPTECLSCAAAECPDALDCFMDEACRNGLLCAFTTCLSGGQPDWMCMLDCFDGDISAAITAGQAIYCISQSCADECGGMLPFDDV